MDFHVSLGECRISPLQPTIPHTLSRSLSELRVGEVHPALVGKSPGALRQKSPKKP